MLNMEVYKWINQRWGFYWLSLKHIPLHSLYQQHCCLYKGQSTFKKWNNSHTKGKRRAKITRTAHQKYFRHSNCFAHNSSDGNSLVMICCSCVAHSQCRALGWRERGRRERERERENNSYLFSLVPTDDMVPPFPALKKCPLIYTHYLIFDKLLKSNHIKEYAGD